MDFLVILGFMIISTPINKIQLISDVCFICILEAFLHMRKGGSADFWAVTPGGNNPLKMNFGGSGGLSTTQ